MIIGPKKIRSPDIVPITAESRAQVSSAPVRPSIPSGHYTWAAKPGYTGDDNDNKYADKYVSTSEKLFAPPLPSSMKSFSANIDVNKKLSFFDLKLKDFDGDNHILNKDSDKFKKVKDMLGLK